MENIIHMNFTLNLVNIYSWIELKWGKGRERGKEIKFKMSVLNDIFVCDVS